MSVLNYYVICSHIPALIGQQAYLTRKDPKLSLCLFSNDVTMSFVYSC